MKQYVDGWHKIEGYDVYVENGRVMHGVSYNGTRTTYPYVHNFNDGGLDNVSGSITANAFRSRVRRGTASMR